MSEWKGKGKEKGKMVVVWLRLKISQPLTR